MILDAASRLRALLALPALLALASCALDGGAERSHDDTTVGVVESPIVGGWPASWAPAVAALVDDTMVVHCSGTLIAPRAVLTAAHCAKPGVTKMLFGQRPGDPQARVLRVASFVTHPDYAARTLTADIAIAVLEEPAPAALWPASLSRTPLGADFVGKNVVLMGYGLDAATMTFGRRGGLARVTSISAGTFTSAFGPSQPCAGDSGGPALVETEAQTIVLGVVSSGDADCAIRATYTRLDVHLASFVDPTLAALADRAARPGERCFHSASCADSAGRAATCYTPPDAPSRSYCSAGCEADRDCPSSMRCVSHTEQATKACQYLHAPGTVGAACAIDSDCDSRACARSGDGAVCAATCILGVASSCEAGFACVSDRGRDVCVASPPPPPTESPTASAPAPEVGLADGAGNDGAPSASCSSARGGGNDGRCAWMAAVAIALCVALRLRRIAT